MNNGIKSRNKNIENEYQNNSPNNKSKDINLNSQIPLFFENPNFSKEKRKLTAYQNFQKLLSPNKEDNNINSKYSDTISSKKTKFESKKNSRVLSQEIIKTDQIPLKLNKKSISHKTFYANSIHNMNEYGLNKINLPPNPPKLLHRLPPKKQDILGSIKQQIDKLKGELSTNENKEKERKNKSNKNLIYVNNYNLSPSFQTYPNFQVDNNNLNIDNSRNHINNDDLKDIINEHNENIQNIINNNDNEDLIEIIYRNNNFNFQSTNINKSNDDIKYNFIKNEDSQNIYNSIVNKSNNIKSNIKNNNKLKKNNKDTLEIIYNNILTMKEKINQNKGNSEIINNDIDEKKKERKNKSSHNLIKIDNMNIDNRNNVNANKKYIHNNNKDNYLNTINITNNIPKDYNRINTLKNEENNSYFNYNTDNNIQNNVNKVNKNTIQFSNNLINHYINDDVNDNININSNDINEKSAINDLNIVGKYKNENSDNVIMKPNFILHFEKNKNQKSTKNNNSNNNNQKPINDIKPTNQRNKINLKKSDEFNEKKVIDKYY